MATSASVLNFTTKYGASFKFVACLRLNYCIQGVREESVRHRGNVP